MMVYETSFPYMLQAEPISRNYYLYISREIDNGGGIMMKNEESYKLTWQDFLFGLVGSTIFIITLQVLTGFQGN